MPLESLAILCNIEVFFSIHVQYAIFELPKDAFTLISNFMCSYGFRRPLVVPAHNCNSVEAFG